MRAGRGAFSRAGWARRLWAWLAAAAQQIKFRRRLRALLPVIGHVQIASVPDRGTPDHGELDYRHICGVLRDLGWDRSLGAEYRPVGATEDSLGWLPVLRAV